MATREEKEKREREEAVIEERNIQKNIAQTRGTEATPEELARNEKTYSDYIEGKDIGSRPEDGSGVVVERRGVLERGRTDPFSVSRELTRRENAAFNAVQVQSATQAAHEAKGGGWTEEELPPPLTPAMEADQKYLQFRADREAEIQAEQSRKNAEAARDKEAAAELSAMEARNPSNPKRKLGQEQDGQGVMQEAYYVDKLNRERISADTTPQEIDAMAKRQLESGYTPRNARELQAFKLSRSGTPKEQAEANAYLKEQGLGGISNIAAFGPEMTRSIALSNKLSDINAPQDRVAFKADQERVRSSLEEARNEKIRERFQTEAESKRQIQEQNRLQEIQTTKIGEQNLTLNEIALRKAKQEEAQIADLAARQSAYTRVAQGPVTPDDLATMPTDQRDAFIARLPEEQQAAARAASDFSPSRATTTVNALYPSDSQEPLAYDSRAVEAAIPQAREFLEKSGGDFNNAVRLIREASTGENVLNKQGFANLVYALGAVAGERYAEAGQKTAAAQTEAAKADRQAVVAASGAVSASVVSSAERLNQLNADLATVSDDRLTPQLRAEKNALNTVLSAKNPDVKSVYTAVGALWKRGATPDQQLAIQGYVDQMVNKGYTDNPAVDNFFGQMIKRVKKDFADQRTEQHELFVETAKQTGVPNPDFIAMYSAKTSGNKKEDIPLIVVGPTGQEDANDFLSNLGELGGATQEAVIDSIANRTPAKGIKALTVNLIAESVSPAFSAAQIQVATWKGINGLGANFGIIDNGVVKPENFMAGWVILNDSSVGGDKTVLKQALVAGAEAFAKSDQGRVAPWGIISEGLQRDKAYPVGENLLFTVGTGTNPKVIQHLDYLKKYADISAINVSGLSVHNQEVLSGEAPTLDAGKGDLFSQARRDLMSYVRSGEAQLGASDQAKQGVKVLEEKFLADDNKTLAMINANPVLVLARALYKQGALLKNKEEGNKIKSEAMGLAYNDFMLKAPVSLNTVGRQIQGQLAIGHGPMIQTIYQITKGAALEFQRDENGFPVDRAIRTASNELRSVIGAGGGPSALLGTIGKIVNRDSQTDEFTEYQDTLIDLANTLKDQVNDNVGKNTEALAESIVSGEDSSLGRMSVGTTKVGGIVLPALRVGENETTLGSYQKLRGEYIAVTGQDYEGVPNEIISLISAVERKRANNPDEVGYRSEFGGKGRRIKRENV